MLPNQVPLTDSRQSLKWYDSSELVVCLVPDNIAKVFQLAAQFRNYVWFIMTQAISKYMCDPILENQPCQHKWNFQE